MTRALLTAAALLSASRAAADARAPSLDGSAKSGRASAQPRGAPAGALSPDDLAAARSAWTYFERNDQPSTGLVNSVDGHPSTTMWDLGSSLFATIAARELDLVDEDAFDARISTMLRTLATQPLFHGELPNKVYDTLNGQMADYGNRPGPKGIGFSAVDLGRLASALEVLAAYSPRHRASVLDVLTRWRSCRLVRNGEMQGAYVDATGEVKIVQEGRLGYEQYAAHGLARLGLDVSKARRYDRFVAEETIMGVAVRRDARDRRHFGSLDAVVTEPWVLDALEYGLDAESTPFLRQVFEVQKRRWLETGVVTARSEDHVDRPPWFVYGTIWADGQAWRTVTADGADAAALRTLSAKAAFSLATLLPDDPYSRVLLRAISGAADPHRGWSSGFYERGGPNRSVNANTNAVILEALLFKLVGPLHQAYRKGEIEDADDVLPVAGLAPTCPREVVPASLEPTPQGPPVPTSPGAPTPAPPRPSDQPRSIFRFDGTVYLGYRGMDGPIAGGVATLWPFGFSFLRFGAEATPNSSGGPRRFLWGLGWDDWHDGTFYLHVDNWGPIRPSDGLAVRQAELNAGYKLPRLCLSRSVCLAPLAGITAPFVGGPYLATRLSLTIGTDWFVMGGLGWTIPSVPPELQGPLGTPRWRVVYGFGRTNWRPGSLFITYYDWGPTSHDGNGVLTIGMNWAF